MTGHAFESRSMPIGVIVADAGIDVSGAMHASVQLDDAPGAGAYTSLWQHNLIGFRAVRYLVWPKRSDAVAYAALVVARHEHDAATDRRLQSNQ